MTLLSPHDARPPGKVVCSLGFALALLAPTGGAFAQAISHVTVSKYIEYLQTSATDVKVNPEPPGPLYGGPYGFGANVVGTNLGSIAAPVITGPYNPAMSMHNGGTLVYNPGDLQWRFGTNGNDFGTSTLANLNAAFPNGTYTVTVNGVSIPLQLTGNAFPNAPRLTLTGGSWSRGMYVIDPARPLTITTDAFTAYGSNMSGVMVLGGDEFNPIIQGRDLVPSPNFLTMTVPANTLVNGREYFIFASFQAVVDVKLLPALPGTYSSARYYVSTVLTVKAETPIFPMTVSASIGPVVSSATANIQYRPQDVGTTGSTYAFAVAPASIVKSLFEKDAQLPLGFAKTREGQKDTPVACVLAQLNSNGQLQQVSASNMQAYVSGLLGAQGASVSVLNNVSTPAVAGATFYVGYGTNAAAMLNNGINRNVVAVPGAIECKPQGPQTGWWWNPAEGGRGYSIETQGNRLFMAAFLYDASGRASWYVASGTTSLDGSLFNGRLLSVKNGQTLAGSYRKPDTVTDEGAVTLAFNSASQGTMVWPGGTVAIERQNIVTNGLTSAPQASQPETGWWWNAAEDGRGFFIEWQAGYADLAGYMYDDAGNPVWYISVYPTPNARTFSGNWWQYANGQSLMAPYRPATQVNANVAPLTVQFTSPETATMTLPGGKQVALTRFRF